MVMPVHCCYSQCLSECYVGSVSVIRFLHTAPRATVFDNSNSVWVFCQWNQRCSPKKKWGTPETRLHLDKDFKTIQAYIHVHSCTSEKLPQRIFGLVLRYSYSCVTVCSRSILILCTEIILHCVSVSNQLQQWTNFCTNFTLKKWRTRPPVEKSGGAVSPPPTTPLSGIHHGLIQDIGLLGCLLADRGLKIESRHCRVASVQRRRKKH